LAGLVCKFSIVIFYFFTVPPTSEFSTLSLHDALPIFSRAAQQEYPVRVWEPGQRQSVRNSSSLKCGTGPNCCSGYRRCSSLHDRSEEHTSELQSPYDLVCRLLLEKKNKSITCKRVRYN